MTTDQAKETVQKYFDLESNVERTTVTLDELQNFVHFIEATTHPDNPAINETRDLLRFMFIDRQHTEMKVVHRIRKEALHKNRHGIRENKEWREVNEDVETLQTFVSIYGVDIMRKYTPLLGRPLHYIEQLHALITREMKKSEGGMTDGQKSSEVDSTQDLERDVNATPKIIAP